MKHDQPGSNAADKVNHDSSKNTLRQSIEARDEPKLTILSAQGWKSLGKTTRIATGDHPIVPLVIPAATRERFENSTKFCGTECDAKSEFEAAAKTGIKDCPNNP